MADTPKHSVSVAGIVVDEQDRVLVVQRRDNGRWEPPGGVLELAEAPEEGARREILEETGVEVEVERLTGVYKNMSRSVVSLVFKCRPIKGEPGPTEETIRVEWVPFGGVAPLMTEAYYWRVLDAFSAGTKVRVHDGASLISSSPLVE